MGLLDATLARNAFGTQVDSFSEDVALEGVAMWADVMKSVPSSKLLLKFKNLYGQASLQGRMSERFAACGIEPDRVMFEASSDTAMEHLGRYGEVDS